MTGKWREHSTAPRWTKFRTQISINFIADTQQKSFTYRLERIGNWNIYIYILTHTARTHKSWSFCQNKSFHFMAVIKFVSLRNENYMVVLKLLAKFNLFLKERINAHATKEGTWHTFVCLFSVLSTPYGKFYHLESLSFFFLFFLQKISCWKNFFKKIYTFGFFPWIWGFTIFT